MLALLVCWDMLWSTFLVRSAGCTWTGSVKLCYDTTDVVLQLPQKSGKKEIKVNLTGIGRDRKARDEDQKVNGARTLSSLFTLILFYETQVGKLHTRCYFFCVCGRWGTLVVRKIMCPGHCWGPQRRDLAMR